MRHFFTPKKFHHRLYFCVIIASLLLGLTNATNTTSTTASTSTKTTSVVAGDNDSGLVETTTTTSLTKSTEKVQTTEEENLTTTTNGTVDSNVTSIFHKPQNWQDVRNILLAILQLFAQGFMIFGGVIPYIPQYLIIKRKQNAEGFSNYVCLTLLVANIIRIEFWFGKRFEIPLLLQSIVMIICMLVMLELWTRVHAQSMRRDISVDQISISNSREQLTDEVEHTFTDFQVSYFWRWTKFTSYLQFLCILTVILSLLTWVFIKNVVYIETIGFLAVFCEALLGLPQFIKNFRLRSTEGMSVKMVLLWASGDIFKTVYFVLRKAPKQFWLCGMLQISIDIAILCQVIVYSKKFRFRRQ